MAQQAHINAQAHPAAHAAAAHAAIAAAAPSNVWVSQDAASAPIPNVQQSTPGGNHLYWLNVNPGKTVHSLQFIVTFKPGSPLSSQDQLFTFPGGYGGITTTPFGVPYWGGNPIIGPATLTVLADGAPVGSYNFNVTT